MEGRAASAGPYPSAGEVAPPNAGSPAFSGRIGWVWDIAAQFGGDIQQVIALAQAAGCAGVLIKSNDEGRIWAQAGKATVDAVHAAGLRCLFWGYAYGAVDAFIVAAQYLAATTGCDGFVVDAEAELRDSGNAGELARNLREALPDFPLAVAPLPILRYHQGLDYPAWAAHGYTLIPQIYSNALGPQTYPAPAVLAEWRATFPDAVIAPAFGAYADPAHGVRYPTPAMLADFLAACDQYGCIGHSFWRLDTLHLETLP